MMRLTARPGHRPHRTVGATAKSEPARGEPVAHQQRADRADDGAGDHVARMMRRDDDPAERDQHRIDPHQRPRLREERADGDQRRKGRGGMARRQARVAGLPGERLDRPRRRCRPTNGRARPIRRLTMVANRPGSRDRRENKAEPHRQGRKNAARRTRGSAGESSSGQRQQQKPGRPAGTSPTCRRSVKSSSRRRSTPPAGRARGVTDQAVEHEHGRMIAATATHSVPVASVPSAAMRTGPRGGRSSVASVAAHIRRRSGAARTSRAGACPPMPPAALTARPRSGRPRSRPRGRWSS